MGTTKKCKIEKLQTKERLFYHIIQFVN